MVARQTRLRLLLVTPDSFCGKRLATLLFSRNDIAAVKIAGDAEAALREATLGEFDVIVVEPGLSGMSALDEIYNLTLTPTHPDVILLSPDLKPILVLHGVHQRKRTCVRQYGRLFSLCRLFHGIDAAYSGSMPSAESHLIAARGAPGLLTAREKEVLQLIAAGKTSREIALILHIACRTAEHHREKIMEKLDLHNIASLTRYAIRNGLVGPRL